MKDKISIKERSKLFRLLRRYFFYYLRRKEMIRRHAELTKGKKCHMCGCCKNKSLQCKYFNKEKNFCMLWATDRMPLLCKITPFDMGDMSEYQLENCAFSVYFNKNKK